MTEKSLWEKIKEKRWETEETTIYLSPT
jgi:hypothetical protein